MQLHELRVLEVAVHATDGDMQQAGDAIEEAEAEHVELEETHHGGSKEMKRAGAAAELERLLRGEGRIAVLPVEIRGEAIRGVVEQVAFQGSRRHGEQHFLVDEVVAPARVHAVEKAR